MATTRPAFCSEADFQLGFAWELKKLLSSQPNGVAYDIFLERRFMASSKEYYMDVCAESSDELYLIELKYKTIKDTVSITTPSSTPIVLKDQAANDLGRYGYLKDIHRIEDILSHVSDKKMKKGFAIILTNDHKYYVEPEMPLTTVDHTFRIHERKTELNPFVNPINWTLNGTSSKLMKNYPPFSIKHIPTFKWNCYSKTGTHEFKYLITEI